MTSSWPWLVATLAGPLGFVLGHFLRPFIAAGKSSPPPGPSPTPKDIVMAVFAELEQPLADLAAAVASLPDKVAAAVSAAEGAAAQDKADTLAAVEPALANATTAINGIGAALAPAPAPDAPAEG